MTKYKQVFKPQHPKSSIYGYYPEHRIKMEQKIGRFLIKSEIVHHLNGDCHDNRLENLELMSISQHMSLHQSKQKNNNYKDGRCINPISCPICGKSFSPHQNKYCSRLCYLKSIARREKQNEQ
jgi:hypothetical protein